MLNRSAVFSAAWKSYRLARPATFAAGDETGHRAFLPSLFAKMLRNAWAEAKKAAAHAATVSAFVAAQERSRVAVAKALTPAEREVAIIRAREDLAVLDYAPLGVRTTHRRADLSAQLAALTA